MRDYLLEEVLLEDGLQSSHWPLSHMTVAVDPSFFWTWIEPVDLSAIMERTAFLERSERTSRTDLEAEEAAAIASLYLTSVLGEMSKVGVRVWDSFEPEESAEASAPSPMVVLTVTETTTLEASPILTETSGSKSPYCARVEREACSGVMQPMMKEEKAERIMSFFIVFFLS